MFKESFKYYKSKCPIPDFSNVVDCDDCRNSLTIIKEVKLDIDDEIEMPFGVVQPVRRWLCYALPQHPGLLLLRNPFSITAQRYFIARCLRDYPRQPNVVNLNAANFAPPVIKDWWTELQNCSDQNEKRRIKKGMRWTTLGYHHDWDTKVYNEEMRSNFPPDLGELCKCFAKVLGFGNFTPQAAIVNYYPIGTTLAGHTDHSEVNREAPLFSFSFGQPAIFLIGGLSEEQRPTALLLRSGDVLVMSREARLCYHAVPRIMKATIEPWNKTRHNHNNSEPQPHTPWHMSSMLLHQVENETFWAPFKNYLDDSRININVRQVLNNGETYLA